MVALPRFQATHSITPPSPPHRLFQLKQTYLTIPKMASGLSAPVPIPAGAYVVRNRHTSTVLHLQYADASSGRTSLQASGRNEGSNKDQQIWWIEPLPHHGGQNVYSISIPGSGKALEADPKSGTVCRLAMCDTR